MLPTPMMNRTKYVVENKKKCCCCQGKGLELPLMTKTTREKKLLATTRT